MRTNSVALGLPYCQNPEKQQTNWSIVIRISAIVLGLLVASFGALVLKNIIGINQLSTPIGWASVSLGAVLVLAAACVRCVENSSNETSKTITKESEEYKQLESAAAKGNLKSFKSSLKNHDLDDKASTVLLSIAVHYGHAELVQFLIKEKKVSPKSSKDCEFSALYKAVQCVNTKKGLKTIQVLIEHDASLLNEKAPEDFSPLHLAVYDNRLEYVKALVEKGALTNAKNVHGDTPLHVALGSTSKGLPNIELVEFLDTNGASLIELNNQYATPLALAKSIHSEWYTVNKAKLKALKNAKTNTQADEKNTALHKAVLANKNENEISDILVQMDVDDINAENSAGNTALHLALGGKDDPNINVVKVLISAGMSLEKTNKHNKTPLELAQDKHSRWYEAYKDKLAGLQK